jgi:hypothetical protein
MPTSHIFEVALQQLTFFHFRYFYAKFLLLAPGSGARSAFSIRIFIKFELLHCQKRVSDNPTAGMSLNLIIPAQGETSGWGRECRKPFLR